ncbi:MAG TPA: hypothetical protein DCZ41_02185 [Firmicutes bacterium]|nr:hypothetical protein [Bacillota bacterium]
MKMNRTPKFVLSGVACMTFVLTGCSRGGLDTSSSTDALPASSLLDTPVYKKGDVVLLNGFESVKDMYAMKQTNLGIDSIGKMSISSTQKKEGSSSLLYEYQQGGNPLLLQRIDHSLAPTLDWGIIDKVSIWVFNTQIEGLKANLKLIANGNLALLTSESQSLASNEWTQLSFDIDAVTRYKNKNDIVGITLEMEMGNQEGTFYIDQMEATIGDSVSDQDIANPVIQKITDLPEASEIDDEKEFLKVLTVKGSYDALTDAQKALVNNVSKLNECVAKTDGYGLLFDAGTTLFSMITTSAADYNWSGAMLNEDDPDFGARIHLNVSSTAGSNGGIMELRYGALENASEYNEVILYVYNPIAEKRTLISATGQAWSGLTCYFELQPESWNRIRIPMTKLDASGGYFLVQQPVSDGWLFSGFLGITNERSANDMIATIDALPDPSSTLTDEDTKAIQAAKDAYDSLSEEAQKLVTNKAKLEQLVAIAIYGELVKPVITLIENLPDASAIIEYSQVHIVEKAKEAYDELPDEAKVIVTNADKLNLCLEKAEEISKSILAVKAMLSSLDDSLEGQDEIFRFLSAKEIYESLSEGEKAKLTSEEKALYDSLASKTSGYRNLYSAKDNSLLTDPAPGDYTNVSVTRNAINDKYGNVFALKVKKAHEKSGATSFKPFASLDVTGIKAVRFAIFNPTGAWQNNSSCVRSDWGKTKSQQLPGEYQVGEGKAWSIIEIPVKDFYDTNDVFFVLNSAGANFKEDERHPVTKGTWLISSFYGVTDDAYYTEKAADTVALVDALPEASSITDLSSETKVNEAKASYDALPEEAKAKVTNVEKLNACVSKIEAIIGDLALQIDNAIEALPAPETITKENFSTYRDAILSANNEYTMARQSVKDAVTKADKLEQLVAKLKEFNPLLAIDMIDRLPLADAIASESDMVQVLSVKNFLDSLTSEEQAAVTNANKLTECLAKCDKAKSLVSPLAGASGIASGRDTGNKGETGTTFDATYGSVFTVRPKNANAIGDFHFNNVDATSYEKVAFNIFNPLNKDASFVLYTVIDGSCAKGKVFTLKANSWNTIVFDTATYGSNFFFILNDTSSSEGTWLISNLIGLSESALPQETVLLRGGTEGALN